MSRGAAMVFQVSDNNPRETAGAAIFLPTFRSVGTTIFKIYNHFL
jgi:hypothetical protein